MNPVPVTEFAAVVRALSAELMLAIGVIALVLMSLKFSKSEQREQAGWAAAAFIVAAGIALYMFTVRPYLDEGAGPSFVNLGIGNRMLVIDRLAIFFKFLFLGIGLLSILIAQRSKEIMQDHLLEFYALILAVIFGMMFMATSADFLMIYLAIEMVSILSYILAGFVRGSLRSSEASLKYLLYGAMSSGIMIYGMSLIYGMSGTTNIMEIAYKFRGADFSNDVLMMMAMLFVFAGIGYKIASVPFHFWCPDVYQGAPLPVTAFFSVGPKAAGFALAMRFFVFGLSTPADVNLAGHPTMEILGHIDWRTPIYVLSIATMTLGNLAALRQNNAKRLLAYSSIAHAGYLMMGLVALTPRAMASIPLYLVIYAVMNLGAFFVVQVIAEQRGSDDLDSFRGSFKEAPWLGIAMCVFMFSLTGLPPLAGFAGKFYLFGAVVEQAAMAGESRLWVLLVVGVLNSAISLFYYVRVIRAMMAGSFDGAETAEPAKALPALNVSVATMSVLMIFVIPTVVMGVSFGWLIEAAEWAFS